MPTSSSKPYAIYAQSGGVTAVINASAQGVIQAARQSEDIKGVFAAHNGINGVLGEALLDMSQESPEKIDALSHLPAAAFGSCRHKLKDLSEDSARFERILQVCDAHDVGFFFYNGGNDSMDTVSKLHQYATAQGYPLRVMGVPKTIDNDLMHTDNCPGFGSAAKYNAISMLEASRDTESMHSDSTRVFLMEVMGRNAGWLAAATGLASQSDKQGPHLILLPERSIERNTLMAAVEAVITKHGFCCIGVSEGVRDAAGNLLSASSVLDSFGHPQLEGAGRVIQSWINADLKQKTHLAVLDYCQRSARHAASAIDVKQAMACGQAAVQLVLQGQNGLMVTLQRVQQNPYNWTVGSVKASAVANQEKSLPAEYIREDGLHITEAFRQYCVPLIQGEALLPYENGLPVYPEFTKTFLPQQLPAFS